jgi:hypothetical protein
MNEQERYARWLEWGTRIGLTLLVASFAAYLTGLLAPHVPIETLPQMWTLPAEEYLRAAQLPSGWGWLALLDRGDVLNLAGIAVLSGCSIACLVAVIPVFRAQGDRALVAICVAAILVQVLAASGVFGGGH